MQKGRTFTSRLCKCARFKLVRRGKGQAGETILACREAEPLNVVLGPPHIPVQIANRKVNAILDTGADRSIISHDLFKHIYAPQQTPPITHSNARLKGATGNPLTILGQAETTLNIADISIEHPLQIISNMSNILIIGNDVLVDKITISKGREIVIDHQGKTATVPIHYKIPKMKVMPLKNEVIAPECSRILQCKVVYETQPSYTPINNTQFVAVYQDNNDNNVIRVEDSLTPLTNGKVHCMVTNPNGSILTIESDQEIATATPLTDTYDPNIQYAEFDQTENFYYIHDREERDKIFLGNEKGIHPLPSGYDHENSRKVRSNKPVDVTTVKTNGLNEQQRQDLIAILKKYDGVFSTGPHDYGCTPLMTFSIETGNNNPIAMKYRPIPLACEKEVRDTVQNMLDNKIIEPANSPWNSTLVLVRKPNGKLRICVNLKGVNSVTTNRTNYPINLQEESFARLCNGKYFFRLDLSQAYYAIPMASEADKDKTAFPAFGQQYRFNVAPFGAKYLPSNFNRLMTMILHGLDDFLFYYFDDVIGTFQTPQELIKGLRIVLFRILSANLRINFEKSDFCLTQLTSIKWLGMVIKDNKLIPDYEKIKAIIEMPIPDNKTAMLSFLGAVNFHRRHLQNIAEIAGPLYKITSLKAEYKLTDDHIGIIKHVKALMVRAPALALPDTTLHFVLTSDASDVGVGGCLTQINPDDPKNQQVVGYCSRLLTECEQNGSSCEKELLGILYAIQYYNVYLIHKKFTLKTDARSLIYMQHFQKPNKKMARFGSTLDEYDFDIVHEKATRSNMMGICDMLSRAYKPCAPDPPRASYKKLRDPVYDHLQVPDKDLHRRFDKETFRTYAAGVLSDFYEKHPEARSHVEPQEQGVMRIDYEPGAEHSYLTALSAMGAHSVAPTNDTRNPGAKIPQNIPRMRGGIPLSKEALKQAQQDDPDLQRIKTSTQGDSYTTRQGLLCRIVEYPKGHRRTVVCLPRALIPEVLRTYHEDTHGMHVGRKKLYGTLKQLFYWKGMEVDISSYCAACVTCSYQSPHTNPQVIVQRNQITTEPNALINIDIVGPFPRAPDGSRYILTMQCDFSKFILAEPLPRKTGEQVARAFTTRWITAFGMPKYIRSDEGTDCDSAIMQYLCAYLGIKKIRTPIYSPQANPIERWHSILNRALRTWVHETNSKDWPAAIPFIVHGYNTSVHTMTQLQPQEIFLGKKVQNPYLPEPPIPSNPTIEQQRYLTRVRKARTIFEQIARDNLRKQLDERNKKNARKPQRQYEVGQYILVRNFTPANKLDPKWVGPYKIIKVAPNSLHCIKWDTEETGRYRLQHHHKADPTEQLKRIVHPKDVRLYDGPIPPIPIINRHNTATLFKEIGLDHQEVYSEPEDLHDETTGANEHHPGEADDLSTASEAAAPGPAIQENPAARPLEVPPAPSPTFSTATVPTQARTPQTPLPAVPLSETSTSRSTTLPPSASQAQGYTTPRTTGRISPNPPTLILHRTPYIERFQGRPISQVTLPNDRSVYDVVTQTEDGRNAIDLYEENENMHHTLLSQYTMTKPPIGIPPRPLDLQSEIQQCIDNRQGKRQQFIETAVKNFVEGQDLHDRLVRNRAQLQDYQRQLERHNKANEARQSETTHETPRSTTSRQTRTRPPPPPGDTKASESLQESQPAATPARGGEEDIDAELARGSEATVPSAFARSTKTKR